MTFNYETALGFVISLRPRMAVTDADEAARRLLDAVNPNQLMDAIKERDWPSVALLSDSVMHELRAGRKIHAIKGLRQIMLEHYGSDVASLKDAKDAVESRAVTEAVTS